MAYLRSDLWRKRFVALVTGLLSVGLVSCDPTVGPPNANPVNVSLSFSNLPVLDEATHGTYEAWSIGSDGSIWSAGRFNVTAAGTAEVVSLIDNPEAFMITVEPVGDMDDQPSSQKLLGGMVFGDSAELDIHRYVSPIPLEDKPGTHVLFTPSDNAALGYPSYEDAGIWLFNISGDTIDGSFYLDFSPLTKGWIYEGWVVRDYGLPSEVWVSYGKFEPDNFRQANVRDDTGLGPFSGQLDYEKAMPQEIVFPGDDWVANPYDLPVPGGLTLPFDLNGTIADGIMSRWTHVITVEPIFDETEDPWLAEPFFIKPYRNPIGEGTADEPRTILFFPDELPMGVARITGPA